MIIFLKSKIKSVLDKISDITGIDMRYVARGGAWSTLDFFVGNGAALLLAMAFARLLPQDVYGVYSFVLSWAGIFSMFALSGIDSALAKSIAEGYEGDLQVAIKYKLKWGLIASSISLGFAVYYLWQDNNTLALSFLVVSVFLPSYLASGIVSKYFFAKQLFGRNTFISVVDKSAYIIVMVTTLFFSKSAPIILLSYFIPNTVVRFSFTWWAIIKYQKNNHKSPGMKRFAMHITLMNIIGGVSKRLDSILLFHFVGAVEVAVYKFALIPFEKIQNAIGISVGISGPRFAKRSYEDIYQFIKKKLAWFNLLVGTVGLASFIVLPWAFRVLFPQYLGAVYYGRILLLPLIFAAPAVIQGIWYAKAEVHELYILKLITHVSRIVVFAMFIPFYGVAGAIWSQVAVAFFAGFYIFWTFFAKKNKFLAKEQAVTNHAEENEKDQVG